MSKETSKKRLTEVNKIPTTIKSEDGSVPPKTFDILEEMKKHINPAPYSWDELFVWVTTYPTLDPYLEVDRTVMPNTRPSMGSVTVHCQRPDDKQSHFGIADFWDLKESHHNPEFWYKDFNGVYGFDKGIAGHRDFDLKQNVRVEMVFDDELIDIDFRGRNQNENAKT